MKRFIRYLYEYEKDKRIRNVGFIKVETGCEETIVHLQGKGFHDREERMLVLYLFSVENEKPVILWQEKMNLTSPVLSWNYRFSKDDIGGLENYTNVCGVIVETGSGRRMAATWDDRCVDVSQLKQFVPECETVCEGRQEERVGRTVHEEAAQRPKEECAGGQERTAGRIFTRISRQDISKLPRCEWKLANNKFLMHGYNTFHYLVLIDDENNLKLGVPGIYHIEEAKCAKIFGFGEFVPASEQGDSEIFGYWCRSIKGIWHR